MTTITWVVIGSVILFAGIIIGKFLKYVANRTAAGNKKLEQTLQHGNENHKSKGKGSS